MALDKATVARIAHLARIRIPEEQLDSLADELVNILTWVEQLNEVDTENVAPMTSVTNQRLPLREDTVSEGGAADKILANAPQPESGYFAVPKVVE